MNGTKTIPITEDELVIGRKTVDVGKVTVSKTVEQREAVVDVPVVHADVQIERRRIDRPVSADDVPVIRIEGDTTIFPVLEEVVVVEKRLMLREELRITRVRSESLASQRVTLRREDIHVERSPAQSTPSTSDESDSKEQQ